MKIKQIKVEKLFGLEKNDFDITCYPDEHITILYAFNGTGKTTLLKLISAMLTNDEKSGLYLAETAFSRIELVFDTGSNLVVEKANDNALCYVINGTGYTPDSPEVKALLEKVHIKTVFANRDTARGETVPTYKGMDGKLRPNTSPYRALANIDPIAALHEDIRAKATDKNLREKLQKDYIDMLNENFSMIFKHLELKDDGSLKAIPDSDYPHDPELSLKQLSSGEQKLLLLFYELLFDYEADKSADSQDKKQTIVLIDEPESSLHVDWQMHLIGQIQKICKKNDIQALIATHSPDIVTEETEHLMSEMLSKRWS